MLLLLMMMMVMMMMMIRSSYSHRCVPERASVSLKRGVPPDLLPSTTAPAERGPQALPQAQAELLRAKWPKMETKELQTLQA